MRLNQQWIIILLLTMGKCNAFSQTKAQKIDKLMNAYHQLGQFNGSLLVAENGKIIYKNGFGLANMQWNIPNKPDTKFLLASLSKQFTAMLILQLVKMNLVSLDAKISRYLHDYPPATGDKITIHQLLTHTSGIPDIVNFPDFDEKYAHQHLTTRKLLALFDSLPLEFEPGSRYSYQFRILRACRYYRSSHG